MTPKVHSPPIAWMYVVATIILIYSPFTRRLVDDLRALLNEHNELLNLFKL